MPNIKASILSVKSDAKRHAKNAAEKSRVRTASRRVLDAVEAGIISWDDIRGTLADIYDQGHLRENDTDITIYKCVGAGYFDLAVAGGVMKMFA